MKELCDWFVCISLVTFTVMLLAHYIVMVNFLLIKVFDLYNLPFELLVHISYQSTLYVLHSTVEFLLCNIASNFCIFYVDITWRIIMLCFYVAGRWRGMLTVEYDSGSDAVFSKVQLNAVIGAFCVGRLTEHLKASYKLASRIEGRLPPVVKLNWCWESNRRNSVSLFTHCFMYVSLMVRISTI